MFIKVVYDVGYVDVFFVFFKVDCIGYRGFKGYIVVFVGVVGNW